jgi:hypothetical protein
VHEVSSSQSTISINAVKDIVFVFHPDVLEYELPNCVGMSRVFYTRYQYDNESRLVEVDCHCHLPFSNVTVESFPSHIWNSILDVKRRWRNASTFQSNISSARKQAFSNIIRIMELHYYEFSGQWCSDSISSS